jgi:hypothetical protein
VSALICAPDFSLERNGELRYPSHRSEAAPDLPLSEQESPHRIERETNYARQTELFADGLLLFSEQIGAYHIQPIYKFVTWTA